MERRAQTPVGRAVRGDGYGPWSAAMQRALYGPDGFYRAQGGPAAHFRTSVHASPLFAQAVVRLLHAVDEGLGRPRELAFVDVGAGGGELSAAVAALASDDGLAGRLRVVAVEVADRPDGLDPAVEWRDALPTGVTGLLVANEWLDNVPCDVVEATPEGWRGVEVAADGSERLGSAPSAGQQAWLEAWWPLPDADGPSAEIGFGPAARAEIGTARDAAWREAVASLDRGVAVAIDYAHTRATRPRYGTLTGYAQGRQVTPVPDGSCDLTAHVALDACAAAARADWTVHAMQREVLHRLGTTGARPELTLASSDPREYLRALSRASAAAELTDPQALGGFGWLVQGVGTTVPPPLEG
jgi:SAM-dependent MidA family methyltransferase